MSRIQGILAGSLGASILLTNWIFVVYMSRQYDPSSIGLWGPFRSHAALAAAALMIIGTCASLYAAKKQSKGWLVIAALNFVTYILELSAS
jgi:hypothetical protein